MNYIDWRTVCNINMFPLKVPRTLVRIGEDILNGSASRMGRVLPRRVHNKIGPDSPNKTTSGMGFGSSTCSPSVTIHDEASEHRHGKIAPARLPVHDSAGVSSLAKAATKLKARLG